MSVYLILILCIVPAAFLLFVLLNIIRSDRSGAASAAETEASAPVSVCALFPQPASIPAQSSIAARLHIIAFA